MMRLLLFAAVCVLTLVGGTGVAAQPANSQSFYVDATVHGWQNTGIFLKKNHSVEITATGEACGQVVGENDCLSPYGPDGNGSTVPDIWPYNNAPWVGGPAYALVGKVGDQPVFIGAGPTMVSGTGELRLAFNDDKVDDNAGGYHVTISMCRPGNGHGDRNHCHSGPPGQS
jgi:hypothetical protein